MSLARESIIIVGAGIGGLSAGCYALMNGYKVTIFEMHDKPGGLCTSWKRKGYALDYSIHNLAGSSEASETHRIWEELGALRDTKIIDHAELVRIESPDGRWFTIYSDLDRLIEEMRRISPSDSRTIDIYARAVRGFHKIDLFDMPLGGLKRALASLYHLRTILKWSKVSMREFATQFTDPFLSKAFSLAQYDSPNAPMVVNLAFMAGLDKGDLGWPSGGSLRFARNLEQRFQELGGHLQYKSRVTKVLLEEDKAVGVRLIDGSEHRSDIVISASDGHGTIYEMLDGRYSNEQIDSYYDKTWPSSQEFGLQIALGVKRNLSGEPHSIALMLDPPIVIEGTERPVLNLELFSERSGLVPPGKGIIKAVLRSNYDYWRKLKDEDRYAGTKAEVARAVIERLDARFPGLMGEVEVIDVSTPVTTERYTGNFRGLQAWMPKKDFQKVLRDGLSRSLPGLDNFYMVGQWSMATIGLNTAAISAKRTIQTICKEDRRRFSALAPSSIPLTQPAFPSRS